MKGVIIVQNYGYIEFRKLEKKEALELAGTLFDEKGFRKTELGIDTEGEFAWIYAKKTKTLYVYFGIDGSVAPLIEAVKAIMPKCLWGLKYDTRTEDGFLPIQYTSIGSIAYAQYPLQTEAERNAYERSMAYGMKGKLGLNLCCRKFDTYSFRRCMLSTF